MQNTVARELSLEGELLQVLLELEMCSHVAAVNLEPSGRDAGEDIGGKRPPGGVDRREDAERMPGRMPKSAEHFRRRADRARTDYARAQVLTDARAALAAFRRQPAPRDKEHPMPGDYNWKRWVAESRLSDSEIARKCSVKRQYVNKVRRSYRGDVSQTSEAGV